MPGLDGCCAPAQDGSHRSFLIGRDDQSRLKRIDEPLTHVRGKLEQSLDHGTGEKKADDRLKPDTAVVHP
jgi:hypothetical protein